MRYLLVAFVLVASGCTSTGHGARNNRDYANTCGYAMDQLGICRP